MAFPDVKKGRCPYLPSKDDQEAMLGFRDRILVSPIASLICLSDNLLANSGDAEGYRGYCAIGEGSACLSVLRDQKQHQASGGKSRISAQSDPS